MPTQICEELYNGKCFWRKTALNFLNMELRRTNSDSYQQGIISEVGKVDCTPLFL